tara:strand:+ start:273 stop:449 length:177 start_codon:yes stop_codon:yes gene_type:complete
MRWVQISSMKDKIWACIYKKIMTYELWKYMRMHKYEKKVHKWEDFKKVKKETIDKWKV